MDNRRPESLCAFSPKIARDYDVARSFRKKGVYSGEALLFCLLPVGCARDSKTDMHDMPSFHSLAFS